MIRRFFTAMWLLGLATFMSLGFTVESAHAQDAPTAVVEKFHGALIDAMKQGKQIGFDGRAAKLSPVVAETFDIPSMARISTGAAWQKMSEAERADVTKAFGAWTTASYAGNFSAFNGESFVTKGETSDDGKGNVVVNTQLNPKGMAPVAFNYRMRKVEGRWKAVDIFLDGAISQLATFRAQFASVLGKGTSADLIAHMNKLAADAKKGG